jgi:feruloyl-CoA synthase
VAALTTTRVREVPLGPADVEFVRRADSSILLRSPHPLADFPQKLTSRLVHWAREAPARTFIAQRNTSGSWRELTYRDAHRRVRRLAQGLLDRRLSADRPLVILSDNDIEHALLAFACMHVGIAYVPVSSAYSLVSTDHAKLRHVTGLLTPGLVYATDRARFGKAVAAAISRGTEVVFDDSIGTLEVADTAQVDAAHESVGLDTIAKFLLTSGSTGQPKAVINTQRMLCSNQQMLTQALPSLSAEPPVLVDWLPWNHTAGSNHNLGLVLNHGGTIYIDEGKPVPGLIEKTVRNLREIAPTIYFNVPRGYEALLPFLRDDAQLRKTFFSRLGLMQYAAAVLPQPIWQAYEELALQTCGERIRWITGYGATETAPAAMFTSRGAMRAGSVGLPVDGVEMKLVPSGDKLEARFRGPSITPGYWRQPELTQAAFDEEGFYRTGDALRFVDPAEPRQGFEFDGRTAEDFKLGTGTWVSVGPLRAKINAACSPLVQDAVITGHDRDRVGVLLFPNMVVCRGMDPDMLRARLRPILERLAAESTGSSTRIARALVMETPAAIDASEVTDKGSINQRAVLKNRADLVERLYAETPGPDIMVIS